MIDFLITNMLWWHWIVLGLVLVVAEIAMPLFVIIWFGLSAIVVGLIDLVFSTTFMQELAIWMFLSIVLLSVWFTFFKQKSISKSGQSDFKLGTKGIVIEDIPIGGRGKVRFDTPVLGSSEWHAVAEAAIASGTAIHIVDVNGQLIKVEKD